MVSGGLIASVEQLPIATQSLRFARWTEPVSNATSVPGRRHTATVGSSTAAKPRVTELLNFVVTNLSPTFAGRDATRCRL